MIEDVARGRPAPHGQDDRVDPPRVRLRAHRPGVGRPARPHPGRRTTAPRRRSTSSRRSACPSRGCSRSSRTTRPRCKEIERAHPRVRPRPHAGERRQADPAAGPAADRAAAQGARPGRRHSSPRRDAIALRNVRRDAITHLKELEKNGRGRLRRAASRRGPDAEADRRARQAGRRAVQAQGNRDPRGLTDSVTGPQMTASIASCVAPAARRGAGGCPRSHRASRSSWTATAAGRRRRGLPVIAGHRAGTRALRRTVEAAIDLGVRSLSVYAFSTENWTRPPTTRFADLLDLLAETIRASSRICAAQGVRVRFVGRRDRCSTTLAAADGRDSRTRTACNERARPVRLLRLRRAGRDRRGRRVALVRDGVAADEIDEEALRARLDDAASCPIPTWSSAPPASAASRTSCSGRSPTPSSSSRTRCGPTSAATSSRARSPSTRAAAGASAAADGRPPQPRARRDRRSPRSAGGRLAGRRARCSRSRWSPRRFALARVLPHGARPAADPAVRPRGRRRDRDRRRLRVELPWTVAAVLATLLATFLRRRGRLDAGVGARCRSASRCSASSGSATASRSWCCCADSTGRTDFGFNVLLAVLIGTWASDIFAYFGGRLFGRRRLAPAISPNKTVEGFVIGLVFGTARRLADAVRPGPSAWLQALEVAPRDRPGRRRSATCSSLRQARPGRQGLRHAARRPRRRARPHRRAAVLVGARRTSRCSRWGGPDRREGGAGGARVRARGRGRSAARAARGRRRTGGFREAAGWSGRATSSPLPPATDGSSGC